MSTFYVPFRLADEDLAAATRGDFTYDLARKCFESGSVRVYRVDDVYVAAISESWVDGTFPTITAAIAAVRAIYQREVGGT